uniref:Signal peptide peptidase SppA n=1 Tax=candidate division WOR-3 bacterium TaxID=2052148 RepID=A0A7C6AFL4_UNCW3
MLGLFSLFTPSFYYIKKILKINKNFFVTFKCLTLIAISVILKKGGIMKTNRILFVSMLIIFASTYGAIPTFYEHNKFLLASPGAMYVGLYGYDNPALLTYLHQFDLAFIWSDQTNNWNDFDDWMILTGIPNLGFTISHKESPAGSINRYNLSLGMGDKRQNLGIGYEWSNNDTNILKIGSLTRPVKYLSMGVVGSFASSKGDREVYFDIGFRPLGNEKITFFTDWAIHRGIDIKDSPWSTGLVIEPLSGIRITARYFNDRSITMGINFSFGRTGFFTQSHFDSNQKYQYNTYGIRLGAYDRNIFESFINKNKNYLELDLQGELKYQRYLLFDKSKTLLSVIKLIEVAKNDPTISGIAINLSGMNISAEMVWELREKLKDFKSRNKHIVVYIDEAGLLDYYLASIADRIVIDPQGGINLQGLLMGRIYFKNALDKLGIGVDEWRYFKYKSAAETFSRDKMSEADREQRQAIIDDIYHTIKNDICLARGFTDERFEQLINTEYSFLPKDAIEKNLVDTLGRWDEVKEIVKSIEGKKKKFVDNHTLTYYHLPKDNYWGDKPKIAVIYGLGECAMDTGIKARSLVKDIEWVTERKDIKAVVFRVDSPGGSALASDIIAEAIKKCQKKKPVIVSQGAVAGSGGYWLSMNGDKIVASPFTITGSIGVIGLWLYNKELKEKLGFSTDFVKAGEHADLGFGFTYPFLGQLPDRNLTESEKQRMENLIKSLYKEFVTKVAEGRNKTPDEIENIAQGRVWSGIKGKEIGLVDVIGGIETAIMTAKENAHIPENEDITLIELPKPQPFAPDLFQPKIINTNKEYKEFIRYLQFLTEHNGEALLIMPIEDFMLKTENYLK